MPPQTLRSSQLLCHGGLPLEPCICPSQQEAAKVTAKGERSVSSGSSLGHCREPRAGRQRPGRCQAPRGPVSIPVLALAGTRPRLGLAPRS